MPILHLDSHAGSHRVSRAVLGEVRTPDVTESWHPIPHAALVESVASALTRARLRVVGEAHGLACEGDRYFGLLQLDDGPDPKDYAPVIGLRNSHDKSFPAGLAVGSGVFVCDNLAFFGEVVFARKHTTGIDAALPGLIDAAVAHLAKVRRAQDAHIAAYKDTRLTDAQAHDLVIRSVDERVVPVTRIPSVLREWRTPRHDEFAQTKNAWRLFNAYTEVLKGGSIFRRPRQTQALHAMLDEACGLAA